MTNSNLKLAKNNFNLEYLTKTSTLELTRIDYELFDL
jgi:DNA-dependent RNA polymerase auxiliary subunit epsilon